MIELKTERLLVQISLPGEKPNTTKRFDRAAFISQVILDGKHSFCTSEPEAPELPCTGGAGLCSEVSSNADRGLGAGEYFPKFGVGILKKTDGEPYSFRKEYECKYLETAVHKRKGEETVIFENHMELCQGYRLKEKKTVKAEENCITIRYEWKNTGERELNLREYCHNFMSIDGFPLGPEYILEMPVVSQKGKKPERGQGTILGTEKGFTFTGYTSRACAVRINPEEILSGPFYWKLTHREAKAAVEEHTSFRPSWVLVWSIDKNISPEVSYCFSLSPGEQTSYERKWVFTDNILSGKRFK